jgi:DNA-binding CsgD family transcriptional regulator
MHMARAVITNQQRAVLACAARGLDLDQTAAALWLARDTVKGHRCRAVRRLGAHNLAHAVTIAIALGQIQADAALTTRSTT